MIYYSHTHKIIVLCLFVIADYLTLFKQTEVLHIIVSDRTLLSVHIDNGTYITATLHGEQKTSVQIWMLGEMNTINLYSTHVCKSVWQQKS